jgi:hypothetical protein
MGMVRFDGSAKPAFTAMQRLLSAPTNVDATAGTQSATVTWQQPSDPKSLITGYRVVANPSGTTAVVAAGMSTATLTLPAGVATTLTVAAVRGSVIGAASVPSGSVTPTGTVDVQIVPGAGSMTKPASGTVVLQVPVTLSAPSAQTVTVSYPTHSAPPDVNARPGIDYTRTHGLLTFAPGQTTQNVDVTILANPVATANDIFLVSLLDAQNAQIGGYYGLDLGQILDHENAVRVTPRRAGAAPRTSVVRRVSPRREARSARLRRR